MLTKWSVVFCSLLLVVASPAWGKVFLRWTEPAIPSAEAIGVNELVIPWGPGKAQLMDLAKKRGFHVFAEANSQDAAAAADAAAASGLAGVIVEGNPGESAQASTQKVVESLRSSHPQLSILELDPGGKQPQMQGTLVVDKNGILQATSATQKPWIDSNVALTRFEKAFQPGQPPLFSFTWDLSTPVERKEGPRSGSYALAVAEAGAMGVDVILPVFPQTQKALAEGNEAALREWDQVKLYLKFYSAERAHAAEPWADVAIVPQDYEDAYEAMNLLARHNIPFHVLRPGDLTAERLSGLDLLVIFPKPDDQAARALQAFASGGGTVLLLNQQGPFPWDTLPATKTSYGKSYKVGSGQIIDSPEGVGDPEAFAQEVRGLLNEQKVLVRLWNDLTTLAFAYREPATGKMILELVNYAKQPIKIQVRVKGSFSNIQYETPEPGSSLDIHPGHENGFTQFVVPNLTIGGRVELSSGEK